MGSRADLGRASPKLIDGLNRVRYDTPCDGEGRMDTRADPSGLAGAGQRYLWRQQ
jgi:hypothetical protein